MEPRRAVPRIGWPTSELVFDTVSRFENLSPFSQTEKIWCCGWCYCLIEDDRGIPPLTLLFLFPAPHPPSAAECSGLHLNTSAELEDIQATTLPVFYVIVMERKIAFGK